MRWTRGERSSNIEDRRGEGGGFRVGGLGGKLGLGGILILIVLSLITGQDFLSLLGGGDQVGGPTTGAPRATSPEEEKLVDFVSFVLDDVQTVWSQELPKNGAAYEEAKLVLFTDTTRSACGYAEAAMGPFYCPADRKVYIDLGFYNELRHRFGAPGEFAQAYVIAHEVGHHVQNILGISGKVRELQESHPQQAGQLSIRLELQADCLAGVWGHSTNQRNLLEQGDVESGLGAAAAVGDDRIQKQAGSGVHPETWTHGSSAERVRWFKRGLDSGRMSECNTFRGSGG
jgi:predicted metalloprotease